MLLWIILGTLMNYVILFFFTRFFSVNFLKNFIILNFIVSFFLTILNFIEIGYYNEMSYLYLFNWINIGIMKINIILLYDTLTIVMIFVVLFISALVHLYSFSYMRHDPHFFRFIAYLSLFTFFMLVLVTSNNFLQLLIGWEGVGLSSYLLICFWYTRIAANLAAIKAMSVNRIGDIFLLFTIFLIFSFFGSINFGVVFNNVIYLLDFYFDLFFIEIRFIDLVCFFIFLAACGKSAQLLLHIWLPDAMEGPTPVSALIHAATMVTAGVFLVIRCSILFEHSSKILFFMVFLGSLTCFFMSILGAFQQDIKKIVAYSTCSQLGYMFMGCGLSSYNTSFFHLFNHAFFKALLFLSMGVIIHALADEQDLRKMGNLVNFLPYTIVIVFFGNFALLGLPFLAGFYSKDILIEVAFARFYFDGSFAYILGLLAAFFTAFYSTRLFIRIFFSYANFNRYTILNIHEVDILMFIPLITLLLCSFFVGFFFFDVFIGMGSFFFFDSIFINFLNYSGIYFEFENLINFFSFKNYLFCLFEKNIFYFFSQNKLNLISSNNNEIVDVYKFVVLSDKGTIDIYQRLSDFNYLNYIDFDHIFYGDLSSFFTIGVFENNIFVEKNFYIDIIKPILLKVNNNFDLYMNLLEQANIYIKLPEKGEKIYEIEEEPLIQLFNDTYGDPNAFFDQLNNYKLIDKNKIIMKGKELFKFINLNDYNEIADVYKFVVLSDKGTIDIYQKLSDFNYLNYIDFDHIFYGNLSSFFTIGVFENNIFVEKNFYIDIIKPILLKVNNNFDLYMNLLEQSDIYIKLPEKGEKIYEIEEEPLIQLFNDTYGDSDAFFDQLSNYKLIDKNKIIIAGKELFKFIDLSDFNNFINNDINIINKYKDINNQEVKKSINYDIIANSYKLGIFSLLNLNLNLNNNFDLKISLYIKILPLIVSLLGFCVYYNLDNRFILYYHNYYYRLVVLKFYNGLFFDKLFIDVLLSNFYLFSYYSFYKNIESSFFQKYNIYIFEKNVFSWYFFFKIFSRGYFFVYILIVFCFIYFYFFFLFILKFLNYTFMPLLLILFIFSFIFKWNILKDYIKNFLIKNLNLIK